MTLMLTKVEVAAADGEAFEKNSYVALKKNLYFATLQRHTRTRVRTRALLVINGLLPSLFDFLRDLALQTSLFVSLFSLRHFLKHWLTA